MLFSPPSRQSKQPTRDPSLMVRHGESSLVSARELLAVAQQRVNAAKESVRFAEQHEESTKAQFDTARELVLNAQPLLSGASELCRIGQAYLHKINPPAAETAETILLREGLASLAEDARQLWTEATTIMTVTTGQSRVALYQIQGAENRGGRKKDRVRSS